MSLDEREGGGMFTFVSLALAALLLVSAGLLTDASRSTLRSAAGSARRSQLREGAFAGGAWASLKDEGKPLTRRLSLQGCEVTVSAKREGELLVVESRAKNQIGESIGFTLRYSRKRELVGFTPLE